MDEQTDTILAELGLSAGSRYDRLTEEGGVVKQ